MQAVSNESLAEGVRDMIKLRPYQEEALRSLFNYFLHKDGNPILALPTGTGKSVIIAEWIRFCVSSYPGTRVMMLTHVKELIEQNFDKLIKLYPTCQAGIFSAGVGRKDTQCPVTFAGIQSVAKKASLFGKVDMVLIDECHLVSPNQGTQYKKFISDLKSVNPLLKVIGLSATPYRQGLGLLTESDIFTDIAYDCTSSEKFIELIDQGYLSPLVPKKTKTELETKGVKIHAGEYVLDDLQKHVNREDLNEAALEETIHLAADRKHWLIFTTGIAHAEAIAEKLKAKGVSAAVVHSKLSKGEREESLLGFKAGKYRAMVNSNILTTGFDFPDLDCIVMLRPTQSAGLWVQMLGRGTRPSEGKENCLVLDFARNTERLGPINDPVIPKKRGSKGGGEAPIKVCEGCFNYCHSSVRICPYCGWEFPIKSAPIETTASTLDLISRPKPKEFKIEIFNVTRVVYQRHIKEGRPDSIRVDYYCGIRRFSTYICLEHGGYATTKAREWWRMVSDSPIPKTTAQALYNIHLCRAPKSIKVWLKDKYPEILDYDMGDGEEFTVAKVRSIMKNRFSEISW